MKELVSLVGSAKSVIDNGFSRVGRSLDGGKAADKALMLLAARAVAESNAVMLLALNSHANEALPLLRSLVDLAVNARWIAERDSEARAGEFLAERESADWAKAWDGEKLALRARAAGAAGVLQAASYGEHLHANAHGLPWGHVFGEARPGLEGDALLRAAAKAMGHMVAALERRWPGNFEGSEKLLQHSR